MCQLHGSPSSFQKDNGPEPRRIQPGVQYPDTSLQTKLYRNARLYAKRHHICDNSEGTGLPVRVNDSYIQFEDVLEPIHRTAQCNGSGVTGKGSE